MWAHRASLFVLKHSCCKESRPSFLISMAIPRFSVYMMGEACSDNTNISLVQNCTGINKWGRNEMACILVNLTNSVTLQPIEETLYKHPCLTFTLLLPCTNIDKIFRMCLNKLSYLFPWMSVLVKTFYLFHWFLLFLVATAKLLQSYPTLCNPIDSSQPGSPVPGILQTRTLEWVAISFSNVWKWKVKVRLFSRVQPHGLQSTRLLRPWDFLGESIGVRCHCLLLFLVDRVLINTLQTTKR